MWRKMGQKKSLDVSRVGHILCPPMAPRPTYDLANQALGGRLAEILEAKRKEGRTFDEIVNDLAALGVVTSRETIRRWWRDLVDDTPKVEAS